MQKKTIIIISAAILLLGGLLSTGGFYFYQNYNKNSLMLEAFNEKFDTLDTTGYDETELKEKEVLLTERQKAYEARALKELEATWIKYETLYNKYTQRIDASFSFIKKIPKENGAYFTKDNQLYATNNGNLQLVSEDKGIYFNSFNDKNPFIYQLDASRQKDILGENEIIVDVHGKTIFTRDQYKDLEAAKNINKAWSPDDIRIEKTIEDGTKIHIPSQVHAVYADDAAHYFAIASTRENVARELLSSTVSFSKRNYQIIKIAHTKTEKNVVTVFTSMVSIEFPPRGGTSHYERMSFFKENDTLNILVGGQGGEQNIYELSTDNVTFKTKIPENNELYSNLVHAKNSFYGVNNVYATGVPINYTISLESFNPTFTEVKNIGDLPKNSAYENTQTCYEQPKIPAQMVYNNSNLEIINYQYQNACTLVGAEETTTHTGIVISTFDTETHTLKVGETIITEGIYLPLDNQRILLENKIVRGFM